MGRSKNKKPDGWRDAPAAANHLVGDIFFPFKTPVNHTDHTVSVVYDHAAQHGWSIGLWFDLTNTSKFFDPTEIEARGTTYVKFSTVGQRSPPMSDVLKFVRQCRDFVEHNPGKIIGIHCTHGFNRTGYMICAYLCLALKMDPLQALKTFATIRPPGIYRQHMVNEFVERFGKVGGPDPPVVTIPPWDK